MKPVLNYGRFYKKIKLGRDLPVQDNYMVH